jgi:hypothetical protein
MKIIVAVMSQNFPAGTVAGALRYTLTSDAGYSATQDVASSEADFADATAPGNYTASVERLDAAGNVLGSAVTGTLTIDASEVAVDVPASITVSLA